MEHPQPDGTRPTTKVKEAAAKLHRHAHHRAVAVAKAYGQAPPSPPKEARAR